MSFEPLSMYARATVWPVERIEKNKDSQKSLKSVIFHVFGENLRQANLPQNLHVAWCPGRNHVCQI